MPHISDITIIGSGIIGLLTAKEFINAGYQVTLLDKSIAGKESSWAGGGILLPLYPWRQADAISELVIESIKHYENLSTELFSATKIDPEWYDCGILICKNPDIERATAWCKRYKVAYSAADHSFFDHLSTKTINPLWLPSIAQARNPRLLKSLKTYLLDAGAIFIENCEITDCEIKHNTINSLSSSQGVIKVNQVVFSTGAWTGDLIQKLLPKIMHKPRISPVKGQMLIFDAKPNTLPHMILDKDRYLIPRKDGKILAGSSVEHADFDKSTTIKIKNKLSNFATQLLPTLENTPIIHHWAGLRPGTEQGIPYIGKHPEINNLSINAGHFRNGLTMAPASARLLADLVLERKPCINPEPYRLSTDTNLELSTH